MYKYIYLHLYIYRFIYTLVLQTAWTHTHAHLVRVDKPNHVNNTTNVNFFMYAFFPTLNFLIDW